MMSYLPADMDGVEELFMEKARVILGTHTPSRVSDAHRWLLTRSGGCGDAVRKDVVWYLYRMGDDADYLAWSAFYDTTPSVLESEYIRCMVDAIPVQ
jgi:hypothetical protein